VVRLSHLPSVWMRRGATTYDGAQGEPTNFYVKLMADWSNNYIKFANGEVLHLHSEDDLQPLYGVPSYLGGAQEVMLSEESTLFRRKFFSNGAHMGYILVTTDAGIGKEAADEIAKRVKETKGIGNFKNLYVNIPRTNSREPVKVIPMGNIGVNDNYSAIKESTEMQIVAMHGIPPILLNIIPANVGGLGDPVKAMQLFYETWITSTQLKMLQINEEVGEEVIRFKQPEWRLTATP
jgi:PBSX family phage portal protein